jgi:hypothetical protein
MDNDCRMATPKRLDDIAAATAAHEATLELDAELARLRSEAAGLRSKYKQALQQIDKERARADSLLALKGVRSVQPPKSAKTKNTTQKHAATMIVMLSDIHCEESVKPETVNGLNEYNLDVCETRMAELQERFFAMLDHERRLASIDRVIVWLGGDLISGHIHPDTAELAQLAPLTACRWIGERLRGFIDAVAAQASEVIVATNSGNHGRSTEKLRVGTEMDHSFEQNLYLTMAAEEKNKNVVWAVGEGHLNYVTVDGFRVRFCHGHAIRYSGGVYGLALPATKAIAAWDAIERADLTCFGHYHTFGWLRAGRYVSNGSVIGHSAYAVKIKAAYEAPCQACVVIDHGRNEVTRAFPLYCDRDLRKERKRGSSSSDSNDNRAGT